MLNYIFQYKKYGDFSLKGGFLHKIGRNQLIIRFFSPQAYMRFRQLYGL